MAIPTLITELSTTAASNPPTGSETTAEGDNHLRQAYAFIAQNYDLKATKASPTFTGTPAAPTAAVDTNTTQLATTAYVVGQGYAKLASPTFTGTVTAAAVTTTGNTILGNASTDTLNVGNGGIIKDASGNVGFGVTPSAWSGFTGVQVGNLGLMGSSSDDTARFLSNAYYSGAGYTLITDGKANLLELLGGGGMQFSTAPSGSAGGAATMAVVFLADSGGNFITGLAASAPTLTSNSQMVFSLTSNTNLRISVRGTDGTTRVADITLA